MTYIAIISAGRPQNVAKMSAIMGAVADSAHWYVGHGDRSAYESAGARVVAEATLCNARNLALGAAFLNGEVCVQVSDDLKKLHFTDGDEKRPLSFDDVVTALLFFLNTTAAHLAGVAPTDNAFFYPGRQLDTDKFIVGDLFAVAPCDLRFDPAMRLKEDYDYTCQHLERYGRVARVNGVLASFAHRTNKGGAVDVRTEALEQEMINRLKARWPMWIKDNPKRPNEVLLRYSPQGVLI